MADPPCKDCKARYPGCHGSCDPYKKWSAPFVSAREERTKYRKSDELLHDSSFRAYKKYLRGK